MSKAEKAELLLIIVITGGVAAYHGVFPRRMDLGYLVLVLGLAFLVQTLLRDLWLLCRLRKKKRSEMPAVRCMCLESGVGFIPVIIAAILIPCGCMPDLSIASWFWPIAVLLTLLAGFGLKDFVVDLRPFRIRRDPDHIHYRFGFR